ncbi:hypothetical protein AKJ16_DCAP09250 [Drosera capensis]
MLTWLCCVEMLGFENALSAWRVSEREGRLRVEFLLYVGRLSDGDWGEEDVEDLIDEEERGGSVGELGVKEE